MQYSGALFLASLLHAIASPHALQRGSPRCISFDGAAQFAFELVRSSSARCNSSRASSSSSREICLTHAASRHATCTAQWYSRVQQQRESNKKCWCWEEARSREAIKFLLGEIGLHWACPSDRGVIAAALRSCVRTTAVCYSQGYSCSMLYKMLLKFRWNCEWKKYRLFL